MKVTRFDIGMYRDLLKAFATSYWPSFFKQLLILTDFADHFAVDILYDMGVVEHDLEVWTLFQEGLLRI